MKVFEKIPIGIDPIGLVKVRVLLVLVTIAITSFFLARGTTKLLVLAFMPADDLRNAVFVQKKKVDSLLPPGSDIPDPKEILSRNIFDSLTGPLWPPIERNKPEERLAKKEPVPVPSPDDPPPECKRDLFLVASVYFPNTPQRSIVALQGPKKIVEQDLYQQGDTVGESELVSIYPKAAFVKEPSGEYCSLKLFSERNRERKSKKKTAKRASKIRKRLAKRRKAKKEAAREIKRSIEKVGKNRFRIDRELVDKVLKNRLPSVRKFRARPYTRQGKLVGVKLYRIRRNSLLGLLGIRNGDLIRSINGYKLTSLDSAIEAYGRLRNVDGLRVELERRRQTKTLEYQIR